MNDKSFEGEAVRDDCFQPIESGKFKSSFIWNISFLIKLP